MGNGIGMAGWVEEGDASRQAPDRSGWFRHGLRKTDCRAHLRPPVDPVLREDRLGAFLQTGAGVGVGVEAFGFDLEADEFGAGGAAVFLEAVGIDQPRGVVRRIGDDGGEQGAEVVGHGNDRVR